MLISLYEFSHSSCLRFHLFISSQKHQTRQETALNEQKEKKNFFCELYKLANFFVSINLLLDGPPFGGIFVKDTLI